MENNLIEVFILTYNRSKMLETAIRSVLNQTVKTKLTVVDNHSPDDTPQMIERLKAEGADFEYIRRAENGGAGANAATAKGHFSYPYVMVFHDDDVLHPQYIETALRILSENENVSLICSSFVDFKQATDIKHERHEKIHYKLMESVDLFASYVFSSHILKASESLAYPSVIYRSDIYKHAKGRNDLYGKLDDGPFVIECARGGKIAQITTPLVCIRRHPGQDSHDPATACTIEQIFNGNAFYKSFMEKRPETMKLFWMICGRHLKAHSNFGNGTFGILAFIRRAIVERQVKLRSFLLVFEYALQRILGLKPPLLLHRYLWWKTHLLFDERTVCLDCSDEHQEV